MSYHNKSLGDFLDELDTVELLPSKLAKIDERLMKLEEKSNEDEDEDEDSQKSNQEEIAQLRRIRQSLLPPQSSSSSLQINHVSYSPRPPYSSDQPGFRSSSSSAFQRYSRSPLGNMPSSSSPLPFHPPESFIPPCLGSLSVSPSSAFQPFTSSTRPRLGNISSAPLSSSPSVNPPQPQVPRTQIFQNPLPPPESSVPPPTYSFTPQAFLVPPPPMAPFSYQPWPSFMPPPPYSLPPSPTYSFTPHAFHVPPPPMAPFSYQPWPESFMPPPTYSLPPPEIPPSFYPTPTASSNLPRPPESYSSDLPFSGPQPTSDPLDGPLPPVQEEPEATEQRVRLKWTEELARSFDEAVHALGGLSTATPKEIKQAMDNEGVTVQQISSRLQKSRIRAMANRPRVDDDDTEPS